MDRIAQRAFAAGLRELELAANGDDDAWIRADGWFGIVAWRMAYAPLTFS